MSQTLRRNAPSARKVAAAHGAARRVKEAKARTGSVLNQFLAYIPLTDQQIQKVFVGTILAIALILAWVLANLAGAPAWLEQQTAKMAADAGFEVQRVDVRGVKNLNELKVYEAVLSEQNRAMPLVDLEALRAKLLTLSWVQDARVSRQLPDTLVVDIVERKPMAVLRSGGVYTLIDADGHALDRISKSKAKGQMILSGEGAGQHVAELSALLNVAPALKPQVRAAEWVGNRRWNLEFNTGQVLALPEGEKEAPAALMSFARLDGTNRLLGGRVETFDMRANDRIYFRVSEREEVLEADKKTAETVEAPKAKPQPKASEEVQAE